MQDAELFPAKELITRKIYELFYQLSVSIKNNNHTQNFHFTKGTDKTTGKISRGENYLSQPYVILDLPRHFSKDDIFAFRSMFWWGHHFSFTLHLAGKSFEQHAPALTANMKKLHGRDVYACVKDGMWEHHFEDSNYQSLDAITPGQMPNNFLKLSRKMPLDQWKQMPAYGIETYELFLEVLSGYDLIKRPR